MSCLLNVTWLSDSVCTHVTLYALSLCLPLNIIVTAWYRWRNEFVGGHSFGFRAVTRSKKLISKNGNGFKRRTKPCPRWRRATSDLQNYKIGKGTDGQARRVEHHTWTASWRSLLAEVTVASMWRIRRTIRETRGLRKALYFGNHRAHHCSLKTASAFLFIQSNLALFPNDKFCRFLTKRSCLVMRKTSRPYEMVFRHGRPREHSKASQCRCTGCQCSVPRGTSRKTLSILPRVSL